MTEKSVLELMDEQAAELNAEIDAGRIPEGMSKKSLRYWKRYMKRRTARVMDIKIIIEAAENNYSAYSPDYPGCVATGDTIKEAKVNMLSALAMHIKAGI